VKALITVLAIFVLLTPAWAEIQNNTTYSTGIAKPGTLITIVVNCNYTMNRAIEKATGVGYLVVGSPLGATLRGPVYLTHGRQRVLGTNDGTVILLTDTKADGLLVRFLRRDSQNNITMMEGIQLSDGRVLVDGVPVERDKP